MTGIAPSHRPLMRQHGLVIDELPDEVLVYDLERHKAHCLNQTAALVWKYCDGYSAAPEIARLLEKELQAPCPEDLVWLALRQLESLHLLEQPIILPAELADISRGELRRLSRRKMVRRLGIAAVVAMPLVTSIIAPTPAQAETCRHNNAPCSVNNDCCSHLCDTDLHVCAGG